MRAITLWGVAAVVAVSMPACHESEPPQPVVTVPVDDNSPDPLPIDPIEPGTRINPQAMPELTRLVFRSKPKVTSGNPDKIGKSIREALETFTTLVLVRAEPDPENSGKFRRKSHHVGIGMPGEPEDTVITKATASKFGVDLGLFEGKVLAEREKELLTVKSPGATPTAAMFDFSMIFMRDGRRTPIVVRYMSLVDPTSGHIDTAYWVLDAFQTGYQFYGDSVTVLAPNHVMDWEMHVDGGKITFGAPKADAFTSTKLPDGTPIPASAEFKQAATARGYAPENAAKLENLLRDVLKKRP